MIKNGLKNRQSGSNNWRITRRARPAFAVQGRAHMYKDEIRAGKVACGRREMIFKMKKLYRTGTASVIVNNLRALEFGERFGSGDREAI